MGQSHTNILKYNLLFLFIFVILTIAVQLIAYETGMQLRTGIIFSNFLAAACAVSMKFVHDHGKPPDNWEGRLLALGSMVIFSFFELFIGYIILNSEGGKEFENVIRQQNGWALSVVMCAVIFGLYISLLAIYFWGARVYAALQKPSQTPAS